MTTLTTDLATPILWFVTVWVRAAVRLWNGKTLEIAADAVSDEAVYVKRVCFNGEPLDGYRVSARKLLQGGRLDFEMSARP